MSATMRYRITNPCGNAHPANQWCRECERLRRRDADSKPKNDQTRRCESTCEQKDPANAGQDVSRIAAAGAAIHVAEDNLEAAQRLSGAEDRTGNASKKPLTVAERSAIYRAKKKATDPDYLKREAARKKEARRKARKK